MSPLKLVVAVLATWRLSSLLVNEDGPFEMFDWLRKQIGVYLTDENDVPLSFLGKLFECVWCISVWVGTGVLVIMYTRLWIVLIPFALSAGAIIIEEVVNDG